jgi:drug/metabolite transporter (DMT)-like permease
MLLGVAAGLLGALLFGVGAVLQAHAVRRQEGSPDRLLGFVSRSVRDPWTLLVLVMYLTGFVLHAVAIWMLPLYFAQATVAMSLPVTAVASLVLHERLSPVHWSALAAVTAGLVLLALGSGSPGEVVVTAGFAGAVTAGFVLVALLSTRGARLRGAWLGTIAGLGYAGSAIAVRGVEATLHPLVAVAALAVPAYSLVAFWLYSLGMDRAGVSSVTAPLIVAQTIVPALVGVALLGDGVRSGWWPGVVAGLVLATAGAILLSRDHPSGPTASASASASGPAGRPGPAPRRSPSGSRRRA